MPGTTVTRYAPRASVVTVYSAGPRKRTVAFARGVPLVSVATPETVVAAAGAVGVVCARAGAMHNGPPVSAIRPNTPKTRDILTTSPPKAGWGRHPPFGCGEGPRRYEAAEVQHRLIKGRPETFPSPFGPCSKT